MGLFTEVQNGKVRIKFCGQQFGRESTTNIKTFTLRHFHVGKYLQHDKCYTDLYHLVISCHDVFRRMYYLQIWSMDLS